MPVRVSRRVFSATLSACLVVSATITSAGPATAADSRAPEIVFAGEVVAPGQTELDHIGVILDEIIDPTSLPSPSAFELLSDGPARTPDSVQLTYAGFAGPNGFFGSAGATVVRLGFVPPLTLPAEPMEIHYSPDPIPEALRFRDGALNEVAEATVAVEFGDLGGMGFAGATVDYSHGSDRILVVFNESLDLGSIPSAEEFSVTVNGDPAPVVVEVPISDIGIGLIDLVLSEPLAGTETVLVSYAPIGPAITGRYTGQVVDAFVDAPVEYFLPQNATSGTIAPGGLLTTLSDGGPTVSDPLATTVMVPVGGAASITEQPLTSQTSTGYTFFGQEVLITAPPAADAANPLLVTFDLHGTLVPDGESAETIDILRNDVVVPQCSNPAPAAARAIPSPCVWQRVDQPDGSISITVATVAASRWNFGRMNPFSFVGFGPPVNDAPMRNGIKAGAAVPLKFSLGGDRGLAIFAEGSPSSQAVSCDTSTPYDAVEQTVTAGNSALSYNASSDSYTYVWKTSSAWSGCRKLTLAFADGSVEEAIFQFRH